MSYFLDITWEDKHYFLSKLQLMEYIEILCVPEYRLGKSFLAYVWAL